MMHECHISFVFRPATFEAVLKVFSYLLLEIPMLTRKKITIFKVLYIMVSVEVTMSHLSHRASAVTTTLKKTKTKTCSLTITLLHR